MLASTHVIANPVAGPRRAQRRSRRVARRLAAAPHAAVISWTQGPGDATRLTRAALRSGARQIIVLGGDGTLNEVVNGFFRAPAPGENPYAPEICDTETLLGRRIAPSASLLALGGGTGSDFLRTLRERAPSRAPRPVDVMRITYTVRPGETATRYAVNIASMGLGGLVVRSVRAFQRRFVGGTLAYFAAIVQCLQSYDRDVVHVTADDRDIGTHTIRNIAVANARYFGGGLQIAPHAVPDDGCLDAVLLDDVPFRRLLRDAGRIYAGEHAGLPYLHPLRARRFTLSPTSHRPVFLEMDGEPVGRLPATFQVVPSALLVHDPPARRSVPISF